MSVLAEEYKNLKIIFIRDYYNDLNNLEKEKFREMNAAIKLQKNIKMFLCRKRYLLLKQVTLEIQRNFKGYMARDDHTKKFQGLSSNMNTQFFEYHATIIKKHWRGFKCRRNVLDYSERKKYLKEIKIKNEETLSKFEEYSQKLKYEIERKSEEDMRKKFYDIASNLHHLVSTRSIPGVYNPPNLSEEHKPQIYNSDIETHLKSAFKSNFRKSSVSRKINNND